MREDGNVWKRFVSRNQGHEDLKNCLAALRVVVESELFGSRKAEKVGLVDAVYRRRSDRIVAAEMITHGSG
jgi:hypothetical protein